MLRKGLSFLFFVFVLLFNNAYGWEKIPLPGQTIPLKEEEMVLDGQKINSLHCRSSLSQEEIRSFYLRFLPGLGWNEDCPECSQDKKDNAPLSFTKADTKISIVIIPSPLGKKGENDIIIAMSKLKEGEGEEPAGGDLPFIPRYPQSKRISSLESSASRKMMLTYSSADDLNKILDFYREKMADYGWNLANETDFEDLPPGLKEIRDQIKLKGRTLIFEGPRGMSIISVFEDLQEGEDSRIIGIKYDAK